METPEAKVQRLELEIAESRKDIQAMERVIHLLGKYPLTEIDVTKKACGMCGGSGYQQGIAGASSERCLSCNPMPKPSCQRDMKSSI